MEFYEAFSMFVAELVMAPLTTVGGGGQDDGMTHDTTAYDGCLTCHYLFAHRLPWRRVLIRSMFSVKGLERRTKTSINSWTDDIQNCSGVVELSSLSASKLVYVTRKAVLIACGRTTQRVPHDQFVISDTFCRFQPLSLEVLHGRSILWMALAD